MTARLMALSILLAWVGSTLVLAELPGVRRLPLVERLRPFVPGGRRAGESISTGTSVRAAVAPVAAGVGQQVARWLGVSDELAVRLRRVDAAEDATAFRFRQIGWATGGLVLGGLAAVSLGLGPTFGLIVLVLPPLVGWLLPEHQLSQRSDRHQERLFLEMPVTAEQFGMLLSSGYSLTGALHRLADRGSGAVAGDLRRVVARIAHGVDPYTALRDWADTADVEAVHRLVSTLVLHQEATDLGRLISNEARALRREVHRRLLERMERRAQQVWIPVTVATLLPGAIFIAIPFTSALELYGG